MTALAKPSPAEFERLLVEFINVTLLGGKASVDRDTRLFEEGYINSLWILDLIAMVEKTLGARVPDRAVRLATFRTVATIVAAFHPDASSQAPFPETVERIFERHGEQSRFASPIDALVDRGDLRLTGAGQVSLSGFALEVFTAVDRTVARWARDLGAVEQQYPRLIDVASLERAGRVAVIPSEPKASRGIEPVSVEGPLGRDDRDSSTAPLRGSVRNDAMLVPSAPLGMTTAPAVCYHAYPQRAGAVIGPDAELLTAVGPCHRHEDGTYVPLERLADFTMREIIILGTREKVESQRQALVRQVIELVTQLELDATIEPAADPFFTSSDEGRRLMQQVGALKHELRLAVDSGGRTIAVASFNHHHDYFGARFDIRLTDGSAAHSGCVAFGLERWVLALMAQHGVNGQTWPAAARAWLARSRAPEVGA